MEKITSLHLTCITPEHHARTCGYWYLITSNAAPFKAFETKKGLDRWLCERKLNLSAALPAKKGTFKNINIEGHYYNNMTFGPLPDGIETKKLSNGDYTRCTITTHSDGARVINYHSPNVKSRVVYNHSVSNNKMR
jgi:hypothetical protein